MSSARIPSLSGDLPFFLSLLIAARNSSVDLWDSRHFIGVVDVHVYVAFISIFVLLIVVVKFFVEFTKDIGDPFTRFHVFSSFILNLCNSDEEAGSIVLHVSSDITRMKKTMKQARQQQQKRLRRFQRKTLKSENSSRREEPKEEK